MEALSSFKETNPFLNDQLNALPPVPELLITTLLPLPLAFLLLTTAFLAAFKVLYRDLYLLRETSERKAREKRANEMDEAGSAMTVGEW
jgi:hypothetical protein